MVVGGENFSAKDAKVDKTTDWSYEIVMADNAGNSSMVQLLQRELHMPIIHLIMLHQQFHLVQVQQTLQCKKYNIFKYNRCKFKK